MDTLKNFFDDIITKDYEKLAKDKTEEQRNEEDAERLKGYQTIIISLGFCSLFWQDTIAMLAKVININEYAAYAFAAYFAIAIVSMLLGVTAARFPKTSPLHMGFAGNGAFQSMMFILMGFHVETFAYHPSYLYALIWGSITVAVVTIYWGYSAQDPLFVHVLAKLAIWFIKFIWWAAVAIFKLLFCTPISFLINLPSFLHKKCIGIKSENSSDPRELRQDARLV
ncbi:unnamed protein product [Alopecurus aequalis]